jgi:hypothetical protein
LHVQHRVVFSAFENQIKQANFLKFKKQISWQNGQILQLLNIMTCLEANLCDEHVIIQKNLNLIDIVLLEELFLFEDAFL